jgi:hypothetical protein
MKLELVRDQCRATCTLGRLLVDGVFNCYILEDVVRPAGQKVYGQTAIPAGTYGVAITPSPRFKRMLPLLMAVPNFEGVRIHPGNTAADTEGCLLPGTRILGDTVINSRVAFEALFALLVAAKARGESITIEIREDA